MKNTLANYHKMRNFAVPKKNGTTFADSGNAKGILRLQQNPNLSGKSRAMFDKVLHTGTYGGGFFPRYPLRSLPGFCRLRPLGAGTI